MTPKQFHNELKKTVTRAREEGASEGEVANALMRFGLAYWDNCFASEADDRLHELISNKPRWADYDDTADVSTDAAIASSH